MAQLLQSTTSFCRESSYGMLPERSELDSKVELKVIGAGFGRTGTMSLRVALSQLYGGKPVYHYQSMIELGLRYLWHAPLWIDAYENGADHYDELLRGCVAAVDFPVAVPKLFFELSEKYPDAKIILTLRDPKKWYDSVAQTIYQFEKRLSPTWLNKIGFGTFHLVCKLNSLLIWGKGGCFDGNFENEIETLKLYEDHARQIKTHIKPDRLLLFDVTKHGWQELCDFLDIKDVPQTPFPSDNRGEDFKKMVNTFESIATYLPVVGLSAIALLAITLRHFLL